MNRNARFNRQSFLGPGAQRTLAQRTAAVVGLCGGGSHVVQQLAHIGLNRFLLYDPDRVDSSNLNRLVGATVEDAKRRLPKVSVAERVVRGLRPRAMIQAFPCQWQQRPLPLRGADIIFGCVDSFAQRRDLEACARRYLIPYLDIGIDVNTRADEPPQLAGQVILSLPGCLCLTCLGFLTEEKLAAEASRYGDAGNRPQVVWANGVVASAAVGVAVDLLTGWTRKSQALVFLSYYGNAGTVQPHARVPFLNLTVECPHYPRENVGDPVLTNA